MKAFKQLGVEIKEESGFITCSVDKIIGTDIHLDFPSVGATENVILLATLAEGETQIINAAMEPEIVDLANFLNKMGAKIQGAGSNIIKIKGVKHLKDLRLQYYARQNRSRYTTLRSSKQWRKSKLTKSKSRTLSINSS